MPNCKPRLILCAMDITETIDEVDLIDNKLYRQIIGSLIYIMVATSPNFCFTVTRLSQDRAKPN